MAAIGTFMNDLEKAFKNIVGKRENAAVLYMYESKF